MGNNVYVGKGAIIENGCVIRDSVKICEGAVMPAGMVAGTGSVVAGQPAQIVGEVPEGWGANNGGGTDGELYVEGGELRELIRSIKG